MKISKFNLTLIDPVSSKAFWYASETLSFSKAAQEAGMTQSGISKSIARLEQSLESKLFVRGPRNLKLTRSGQILKSHLAEMNERFSALKKYLDDDRKVLYGTVKYAMPESCLMSPHFSQLLEQRRKYNSGIDLEVTIATNKKIESLVSEGLVDFGFMTSEPENLICKPYCLEEYILIGNRPNQKVESIEDLIKLDIIENPDWSVYFNHWKKFSKILSTVKSVDLKSSCAINDLRGAVTFVAGGLPSEVTFIPRHCVLNEISRNTIYEITHSGNPDVNQIYLTYNSRKLTDRAKYIIEQFYKML